MALTQATAREFWIRSPVGEWQYFLIRHDSVIEVQADGRYIPREVLPLEAADLSESTVNGN